MTHRQTIGLVVAADQAGQRLDRWLAAMLPERSRSEVQRWIRDGLVTLGGVSVKAGAKLIPGQVVTVRIPETIERPSLAPESLPLNIIYEDDDLLVLDKAAGMVVHPAPGHDSGTLVNAILHHCPAIEGVGGERRPGIVHRLDKETSGLIVVAKHDRAHRNLQTQFKQRSVGKEYLALVEGRLTPPTGRIVAPIGRHPTDRKRQAVLPLDPTTRLPHGREAVTDYQTLATYTAPVYGSATSTGNFTLVQVNLHTGRTHQIRVHFAWLKHPIVGDTTYGYRTQRLPLQRQFLHAHRLRLRLPSTGSEVTFVAPLPPELQALLDWLNQVG